MAWAYNVLRIGPYFMNFAYVYTLCHKEGHSQLGLFKKEYAAARPGWERFGLRHPVPSREARSSSWALMRSFSWLISPSCGEPAATMPIIDR